MIQKIKQFWRHSYETDRVAFFFELTGFVFAVGASLTLAITAQSPDMRLIYPFSFIGSITAVYAYYRRKLVWSLLLTAYFSAINLFGFAVAMGWF